MPPMTKYRKMKRNKVLAKRGIYGKNYPNYKSYKPLCEKLKNNNNSLAKALSKEKQECQLLFSQNLNLVAEIQDLGLACNKRDTIISNVLENSKEILKALVTMTGYVTNTITTCQEFVSSSGGSSRFLSKNVNGRESIRRLSMKSPAKGVVKPMVSGHTITKPTINLNRVNMHSINNPGSLSVIEEVSTPPRRRDTSNTVSPTAVRISHTNCETRRTCRLSERLSGSSPRKSQEHERRLSKRSSRRSGRMTGSLSRMSGGLSRNDIKMHRMEQMEYMGSPRVKLNDVSKLLRNSQRINIRLLNETQDSFAESPNKDNNGSTENLACIAIPESPSSDRSCLFSDLNFSNVKDRNNKFESQSSNAKRKIVDGGTSPDSSSREDEIDPLEGPSWLYKDSPETAETASSDRRSTNEQAERSSRDEKVKKRIKKSEQSFASPLQVETETVNAYNGRQGEPGNVASNTENRELKPQGSVKFPNFVTQRRGYLAEETEEDDIDDFTLIYRQYPKNTKFDINDLKLPVLDVSVVKRPPVLEPEPEITATIQKITQAYTIPSVAHTSMNESVFNQSTVKLPLLPDCDFEKNAAPYKEKQQETTKHKRNLKTISEINGNNNDYVDTTPTIDRYSGKKKPPTARATSTNSTALSDKDPSAVKVVLQKLNVSDVKQQTPTPEDEYHGSEKDSVSPVSSRLDASSDFESNASTNSMPTMRCLRRKRSIKLQEPSLRNKLRRN